MELLIRSFVVLGDGFTPQVFTSKALRGFLDEEPNLENVSPGGTVILYPSGYEIFVQPNRIEVRKVRPANGEEAKLQRMVEQIAALWPLVEPRALGLNFVLADTEASTAQRLAVLQRLANSAEVTRVLGGDVISGSLTFTSELHDARVSISIDTEAKLDDRPFLSMRANVHYASLGNLTEKLQSHGDWYERACAWAEELLHGA